MATSTQKDSPCDAQIAIDQPPTQRRIIATAPANLIQIGAAEIFNTLNSLGPT